MCQSEQGSETGMVRCTLLLLEVVVKMLCFEMGKKKKCQESDQSLVI